mmetsp:Transcript_103814/g.180315  ORF Transcript_103814/g.180315 Transcript_103814/m.180315 type:complete len:1031 (-) Transcript_103814:67-3159(-)
MFFCNGHFCGKFKDQHESPPASDDEDNSEEGLYQPKDQDKLQRFQKYGDGKSKRIKAKHSKTARLLEMLSKDTVATRIWTRYIQTETVEDYKGDGYTVKMEAPVIRVSNVKLSPNMVKSLRNYPHVHTIELVNCNLKTFPFKIHEMSNLRCLQLTRNKLEKFEADLTQGEGKNSRLQRLVLSEDHLRYIAVEALSGDCMQDMVFLDLTKNKLDMLPNDFCGGAKILEFLRLQSNFLTGLPTQIFKCEKLLLLDVTSNRMKSLPEDVDSLPHLRKLYASSNQLTHLPKWIGGCKTLEKIRVSSNKIRELPPNFLNLEHWKDNPECQGVLEELMVDGNPLVVPSITAFEMGGLKQMFRLFREHVHRLELERKQQFAEGQAAIADEGAHHSARHKTERRSLTEQTQGGQRSLALTDANQELRHSAAELTQAAIMDIGREGDIGGVPLTQPADLDRMVDPAMKDGRSFWFSDLDPNMINEIRSMESAVLLVKKAVHVETMKAEVRKLQQEAEDDGPEVPPRLKCMLNPNYTLNDYKKRVPPSELDLHFALTVYAAKPPLFSSCRQIFERFATIGKTGLTYLVRRDFDNFLSHLPIKLPEEMKMQMWKLLAYHHSRGLEEERVEMEQFIAVCHVHDIDTTDPFIERVAKVLRLSYYSGGLANLRARILAKNVEGDQTAVIDSDSSDEVEEEPVALPQSLPMLEGEFLPPALMAGGNKSAAIYAKNNLPQTKKKPVISKTEAQYLISSSLRKEDSSSSSDSDRGAAGVLGDFDSSELSAPDFSDSDSSFDAGELLSDLRKREREQQQRSTLKKNQLVPTSGPIAQSDADLSRMMDLDPRALFASRDFESGSADGEDWLGFEDGRKEKKKKKRTFVKQPPRDPNFNTNVFSVRQALREAYRNLPYYDFVALINFVHRGLKSIRHTELKQVITYWHADDPILKHLTGEQAENPYPEKLLTEMGFFLLDQKQGKRYWVWPERHLKERTARNVPRSKNCAGTDKFRLDDMLKLVKLTQNCLNKQGKSFRGHVQHRIGGKR